jgi:hypothetical protein
MAQIIDLATQLGLEKEISFRPGGTQVSPATRRLTIAKAWQRSNAVRRQCFPEGETLFADPAWELLLDLYIEQTEGRPISVANACLAAQVPPNTALRWIDRLVGLGLVELEGVADDRETLAALSDEAVRQMESALDCSAESDRKLGLARLEAIQ